MAVRKVGKYYQIDYYVGSKRAREVLKGVSKKSDAEETERERLRNGVGPVQFKKFKDLANWFLTHPDKASKKTLDKDRERFTNNLKPYFGECKPQAITAGMADDHKAKRQKQLASNATINRELALLRSILRFAYQKEKLSRVPPIHLLPENNVRQRFITEEEFKKILEHLPVDVSPPIIIAYHTAMRIGEVLSLKWKNVDLKRRVFVFETEKSNGNQRAVALHPEIMSILTTLPRGFGDTRLFNLKDYQLQGAWRRACKEAKVKGAGIHDLRRTRATIWHKEKGLPQDVIMSMSGHKTDSMFRRYQIVSTEYVERLAREWAEEQAGK